MKKSLFHCSLFRSRPQATVTESAAIVMTIVMTTAIASILFANPVFADPPGASQSDSGEQARPVAATDSIPLPSSEALMQNEFLRNALSRSHTGLQVIRGPQGEMSVDLQGRFQSMTTARINADGEIETTCHENHDSLEHFLAAHPGSDESDYRHADRHTNREAGFSDADSREASNED